MARRLKRILSLCSRRGFLLKRESAADSVREFDYGPSGTDLKRSLVNEWWQAVATSTGNVYPVDSSIIADYGTPESPLFLLHRTGDSSSTNGNSLTQYPVRPNIICDLSLLEKCIGVYGQHLPFGIAECGRVFTHSSTQEFPLRQQEGECMGVLFLCQPNDDKEWYYHWQKARLRWWKKLAANPENFCLVETPDSELSDHTLKESFIKYNFPWGPVVVEQLSNKGDSQFQSLCEDTKARFKIAKSSGTKTYPHLLSLSASVDQGVFAYICDAYNETRRPYGPEQEPKKCVVLRLHSCLSPRKVAVLPASDNQRLSIYCRMLTEELRAVGIPSTLSTVGAFTYRLAQEDELGTPYRIIVDEKTLETGILSLQDRDTTAMEDMAGRDVLHSLQRMLSAARLNVHAPTFTR